MCQFCIVGYLRKTRLLVLLSSSRLIVFETETENLDVRVTYVLMQLGNKRNNAQRKMAVNYGRLLCPSQC